MMRHQEKAKEKLMEVHRSAARLLTFRTVFVHEVIIFGTFAH